MTRAHLLGQIRRFADLASEIPFCGDLPILLQKLIQLLRMRMDVFPEVAAQAENKFNCFPQEAKTIPNAARTLYAHPEGPRYHIDKAAKRFLFAMVFW